MTHELNNDSTVSFSNISVCVCVHLCIKYYTVFERYYNVKDRILYNYAII